VRRAQQRGREVAAPREVAPAAEPASREDALRIVSATTDFALLQAITRAVGRRIEALPDPDAPHAGPS
jgi:hypothetical protein